MDVCLIPCYNRPEFLWHCLRNIEKAEGTDGITFLFRPDIGTTNEVLEVIAGFKLPYQILPEPGKVHHSNVHGPKNRLRKGLMAQSWSVLTGYGIASKMAGDGLVFYVEDDVMVRPDFFTWGREVFSQDIAWFCAIGSEDTNTAPHDRPKHAGSFYHSQGTYRSIGVIWKAETLQKYVGPHMLAEYFTHPWNYLRKTFPNDPLRRSYCEQDGLIRRIQIKSALPIAYPFEPRCYHAGFYGTNRVNKHKPQGTLDQRIEALGRIIYSDSEMKRVNSQAFYLDSRPCLTSDPTPIASPLQLTP